MGSLLNATATLLEPTTAPDPGSPLQLTHGERELSPVRCSLRDLSVTRAIGALGRVAVNAYTCRLHTTAAVKPGWRVRVTRDGETDPATYVVQKVSRNLHTVLTLEAV